MHTMLSKLVVIIMVILGISPLIMTLLLSIMDNLGFSVIDVLGYRLAETPKLFLASGLWILTVAILTFVWSVICHILFGDSTAQKEQGPKLNET